ncbi:MAG TPA: transcriptional regulator, partial [Burkholderiaceae bacterium]|nr:transcriptional regulator [Burkholderiaceae bacterium]
MRRIWLIFAQAVTVSLAVVFVITTLRPEWVLRTTDLYSRTEPGPSLPDVSSGPDEVVPQPDPVRQADASPADDAQVFSYASAVARAAPSVVSVYTRKHIRGDQRPFMR